MAVSEQDSSGKQGGPLPLNAEGQAEGQREAVMDATTQLLISTSKWFVREADDNLISEVNPITGDCPHILW